MSKEHLQKLLEDGYKYGCIGCMRAFKQKRTEDYEDGHGGRQLEMCSCGCDLFLDFAEEVEKLERLEPKSPPPRHLEL